MLRSAGKPIQVMACGSHSAGIRKHFDAVEDATGGVACEGAAGGVADAPAAAPAPTAAAEWRWWPSRVKSAP